MVALYGSLAALLLTADPAPAYTIVSKPVQSIEAELTYSQQNPSFKAKEWVLFVAQPPELPSQTKVSISVEPAERAKVVKDASVLRRPVVMLTIPAGEKFRQSFQVKAKYQATLLERHLKPVGPGDKVSPAEPLTAAEEKAALAASATADYEAADFQRWLDDKKLRRGKEESDFSLARRVFQAIARSYAYSYDPSQDRRVSKLCSAKGTDCGGMSVLFVAALRSNRVPARVLSGRWAESAKAGDKVGGLAYYQTHIKAEFFAKGIGWVPVDPASAALSDKEGLRHFGHDAGNFLTMHVDPDLLVNTVHFGQKTVPWLQGVSYWVAGAGSTEGGVTKTDWQVKKRP
jgi:transglutaminase-like putative cysteine protease